MNRKFELGTPVEVIVPQDVEEYRVTGLCSLIVERVHAYMVEEGWCDIDDDPIQEVLTHGTAESIGVFYHDAAIAALRKAGEFSRLDELWAHHPSRVGPMDVAECYKDMIQYALAAGGHLRDYEHIVREKLKEQRGLLRNKNSATPEDIRAKAVEIFKALRKQYPQGSGNFLRDTVYTRLRQFYESQPGKLKKIPAPDTMKRWSEFKMGKGLKK